MPQALIGLLFLAILTEPSPQPPLKTIVTVHSSQFCTDLILSVRPALVGLMRNDQLIRLGSSALKAGDRDVKFGGLPESSFNQQGGAKWSPNSGDIELLNARQHQLAAAMAENIAMVQTVLSNPNAPAPSGDDAAKLASIKSQLDVVLGEQRKAINILAGNADTSDLADLYNAPNATGFERDYVTPVNQAGLNGVSPLNGNLTSQNNVVPAPGKGKTSTTDPTTASQVAIANAEASSPFYSPYEKLARALDADRDLIGQTEGLLSKTIISEVDGCR